MLTPTLLVIIDGWGQAPAGVGNAVSKANMPNLSRIIQENPHCFLEASGPDVGLPKGVMGNSEVGHLNIGAGRRVWQDLARIDEAVAGNKIAINPVIAGLLKAVQLSHGRVHFIGLLSDGGVHSHLTHLFALLKAARAAGVPALIHAFLDGRDTPPKSALKYVRKLKEEIAILGWGNIATLGGRYYGMDRDNRWERLKKAWDAMVCGKGSKVSSPEMAIEEAYSRGETDEFIMPAIIPMPDGELPVIHDGDGVFFFNFRADRARLLLRAFAEKDFSGFYREKLPRLAGLASMTQYDAEFSIPVAFPKENLEKTLGEVVADLQLEQLRIAETEKYAHVTYFFNGGRETAFPGEKRTLIPSPKNVSTYDQAPEMSAREVVKTLLEEWETGKYTFGVCNLANLDMVGHTGNIGATIQACEVVDECLGKIAAVIRKRKERLLITADHGNAEQMLDKEGRPQTAHSTNKVLFICIDATGKHFILHDGRLADIGPTVLSMWGIGQPSEMTGESLI